MTDLYILGLLSMYPMSGYDIEQKLKLTMIEKWGGVLVGSIYYALSKLEKRNYIRVFEIKTVGKKTVKIYEMTELGKQYKRECIVKCLTENQNIYPTQLFAGMMFVKDIEKEAVINSLNIQLDKQKNYLEDLINGEEHKKEYTTLSPITKLTFDYIYAAEKIKMQYIQDIMDLIERGDETHE